MKEDAENIVELLDEEGHPARFLHLMTLRHEGEDYVLLTGTEEDGEESEVYILRIDRDERGEDCYVTVEDEDMLQAVFDQFLAAADQDELADDQGDDE